MTKVYLLYAGQQQPDGSYPQVVSDVFATRQAADASVPLRKADCPDLDYWVTEYDVLAAACRSAANTNTGGC